MDSAVPRLVRDLPKAHLHLHMEAAMRRSTLAELADEHGLPLPDVIDFDGFTAFNVAYGGMVSVLRRPEDLLRVIDEAVADAAADGCLYVELGASPDMHADTFGGREEALVAMLDQAAASGAAHGVEVGLMASADRMADPAVAVALAELVVPYAGKGVVSFGLASEERGYPARLFSESFAIAREAGLQSTPHGGELVGPESVWGALMDLHADRILHGVRALEDPDLVRHLARAGTCLDVCPTSNLILGVVDDLATHPLRALLDAGIRCSINADDPTLFGSGIAAEYQLARDTIGLSDAELADCAWSSFECSPASDAVTARARAGIDAWLAA
jgi:adenosine deaminase